MIALLCVFLYVYIFVLSRCFLFFFPFKAGRGLGTLIVVLHGVSIIGFDMISVFTGPLPAD